MSGQIVDASLVAARRQRNTDDEHGRSIPFSIDRRFGFIRRWAAADAAAYEGRETSG
jgi:hypothetical protein